MSVQYFIHSVFEEIILPGMPLILLILVVLVLRSIADTPFKE